MNPFNKLWIFNAWIFVGIAFGGFYLGHAREIALAVAVMLAAFITIQTVGVDRAERDHLDG